MDLFVSILLFFQVNDYGRLFTGCLPYLAREVVFSRSRLFLGFDVLFTNKEIRNYVLEDIHKVLNGHNRVLAYFPGFLQSTIVCQM